LHDFDSFQHPSPDDDQLVVMVMVTVVVMLVVPLVSLMTLDRPGFRRRHRNKQAHGERQQQYG
jgi:hypothetical protein